MAEYIPSPREWVRDQVELYERSGGTEGTTLRDTGLPVIIVTHTGNKTGAIRKTPLMRVKDGASYVLIRSGCTTCAPTPPSRSAITPRCRRCACVKFRTRPSGRASGISPSRPIRPTQSTRPGPHGASRSSWRSRYARFGVGQQNRDKRRRVRGVRSHRGQTSFHYPRAIFLIEAGRRNVPSMSDQANSKLSSNGLKICLRRFFDPILIKVSDFKKCP